MCLYWFQYSIVLLQIFIMLLHRSLPGKIAVGQASQAALATQHALLARSSS